VGALRPSVLLFVFGLRSFGSIGKGKRKKRAKGKRGKAGPPLFRFFLLLRRSRPSHRVHWRGKKGGGGGGEEKVRPGPPSPISFLFGHFLSARQQKKRDALYRKAFGGSCMEKGKGKKKKKKKRGGKEEWGVPPGWLRAGFSCLGRQTWCSSGRGRKKKRGKGEGRGGGPHRHHPRGGIGDPHRPLRKERRGKRITGPCLFFRKKEKKGGKKKKEK